MLAVMVVECREMSPAAALPAAAAAAVHDRSDSNNNSHETDETGSWWIRSCIALASLCLDTHLEGYRFAAKDIFLKRVLHSDAKRMQKCRKMCRSLCMRKLAIFIVCQKICHNVDFFTKCVIDTAITFSQITSIAAWSMKYTVSLGLYHATSLLMATITMPGY